MKQFFLFMSIIFCITAFACKEKKQPDSGKTGGKKTVTFKTVTAKGGLRMRGAPSTKGAITGLLPESTMVKVIKESGADITIAGKTGKWTKVDFNGKKGWVFGGFLKNATDPGLENVPDSKIDVSAIMGKNCGFKLKPDEYADEVTFTIKKDNTFTAECLLHGSGKAKVTGTYSQLPDPTVWRYRLKGTAKALHIAEKARRYTDKFNKGSLVINKKNGKLVGTIKGIPHCTDFSDRELVY